MPFKIVRHQFIADGFTQRITWLGGVGTYAVWGDFGGGTLLGGVSYDSGARWLDTPKSATADDIGNFSLPQGVLVRLELRGATNPDLLVSLLYRPD